MADLTLRDLEVRFPGLERPALEIPALELRSGEQVALTGPSGCGKTTLINVLTGLERVRHGHVDWQGTDLVTLGEGARDRWRAANVGLVMQDFHLFPGLSAIENVLLPQRLARFRLPRGAKEEARRLLKRVGIARLDQPVETMSRGQMQRVAVARALLAHPGIIVADEPTASLDGDAGTAVADLLTGLAREVGATLIVASHDPRLVGHLGRVLRLDGGRLEG
ncbi:ATP-binding cassette domain-containing protein [Ancylobacter sp. MQZ15Z-1]|uniref:ATP-binding cassette domain-containing protein n=1 Tax=Ancylobacter mangrovi TaxID=2972472 RepID=A0A9X2PIN6_9HYPH|nr:ATP-binding cassette domain-containing protein [Ancylobacter mangrovi]MCS0496923.1 ATP-binding cassette domain-containing protein [Ancylobacter mangrovi]